MLFQPDGGIRRLAVDLLLESEEVPQSIWQVENMHIGLWDHGQVQIKTQEKFSLFVIAERGDNSQGWAGLDAFKLIAGESNCEIQPPEAKPHVPSFGDCNFQHTLCDWKITQPTTEYEFPWLRITGNESLVEASPDYDHFGDPYGNQKIKDRFFSYFKKHNLI